MSKAQVKIEYWLDEDARKDLLLRGGNGVTQQMGFIDFTPGMKEYVTFYKSLDQLYLNATNRRRFKEYERREYFTFSEEFLASEGIDFNFLKEHGYKNVRSEGVVEFSYSYQEIDTESIAYWYDHIPTPEEVFSDCKKNRDSVQEEYDRKKKQYEEEKVENEEKRKISALQEMREWIEEEKEKLEIREKNKKFYEEEDNKIKEAVSSWIKNFGSDYLKKLYENGFDYAGQYDKEKRIYLGQSLVPFYSEGFYSDLDMESECEEFDPPSEVLLNKFLELKEQGKNPEVVSLIKPPSELPGEWEKEDGCPAIKIEHTLPDGSKVVLFWLGPE